MSKYESIAGVGYSRLPVRFHSKVNVDVPSGCHEWTAARDKDGYGVFSLDGGGTRAHRVAYSSVNGDVPQDLVIDHLCRNTRCVNPAHLEAVTARENTLRGESPAARNARATECPNGHPYGGDNLYLRPSGGRGCKECRRAAVRRMRAKD